MSETAEKKVTEECHWCSKEFTTHKRDMRTQVFTGRTFCSSDCWESHLSSKGFVI